METIQYIIAYGILITLCFVKFYVCCKSDNK